MSDLFKGVDISWKPFLEGEFQKDYMKKIKRFLVDCSKNNQTIYPHPKNIFRSLELTSYENVKVVVLGQDPYHGPNQANGLCFSVNKGIVHPPSLINIFKEIESDLGIKFNDRNGDLSMWSRQGVMLLNATLTVKQGLAGSHQNKGWESFTDRVIEIISEETNNTVFLLWGSFAKSKIKLIENKDNHLILSSSHPSPFSAYNGFFNNNHFKKTNEYLRKNKINMINW